MKINPYTDYVSCPIKTTAVSRQSDVPTATDKTYDTITVSPQPATDKGNFRDLLTARISMEVRHTAPAGKLEALSRQIADKTYRIDANRIADSMLLLTEPLKKMFM